MVQNNHAARYTRVPQYSTTCPAIIFLALGGRLLDTAILVAKSVINMKQLLLSAAPDSTMFDLIPRYGGELRFLMKMGPSVADASTVLCKPAYGGNVYLYYSMDGGSTWETLKVLETFSYRQEAFTEVT